MSRWFSMNDACITFEMLPGETQTDAEDRLIDALDKAGMHLASWKGTEVEDVEDEEV